MARVLGKAGRFVSQQAGKRELKMLAAAFVGAGVASWISGFEFASLFHRNGVWAGLIANALALGVFLILWRWANRQMKSLTQKEAIVLLHDEAQKKDFGTRLKLYESNSPYHEP